nr:AAA-like domain-containing protein [Treponema sp.]
MKRFNTTGTCYEYKHYMVNIDDRVQEIKKMVDRGEYFCINRGRQYGKTTTLRFLKKALDSEYTVFSISFEGMGDSSFASLEACGKAFFEKIQEVVDYEEANYLNDETKAFINELIDFEDEKKLSLAISKLCKINSAPIVIIIDEVDQAGNYESFIKFLGLLRDKFLNRETRPSFQSVILAGVYDVKNLKLKIRPEGQHQYNSPWNIASQFDVSMELSEIGIRGMLEDYEADHHMGIDTAKIAKLLSDYTSGYPFLVSRLCQIIDEKLNQNWSEEGFLEAIKIILSEKNTLFDDMIKKFDSFPEMKEMLREILYCGEKIAYNA